MIFDAGYYQAIWPEQGVHRHDYAPDLARALVTKYGPVRFLDLGCGCGALVRELRGLGADAWGLDISEFAIANTCAPGRVLLGSVTDIPWKDHAFDVVHSSGLWEYVAEAEVPTAVREIHRVGRFQQHNIDHDQTTWLPEFQHVTWKPLEWWTEKLERPKVLVACPNHECKEYSFERWIDNVKALTYPNVDILVVDNSPTLDFFHRWKDKVPMIHIQVTDGGPEKRINWGMEAIRLHFLGGPYDRWLNIESDVIPPHDVIEQMLTWGEVDWLSHAYPERNQDQDIEVNHGLGCSMFSRRLMEPICFYRAGDNYMTDGWLWNQVKADRRFTVAELWHFLRVGHLGH